MPSRLVRIALAVCLPLLLVACEREPEHGVEPPPPTEPETEQASPSEKEPGQPEAPATNEAQAEGRESGSDSPTRPDTAEAQVTRVIDGDTIEVSIDGETYKVRYIGIDTPETVHPTKDVEEYGEEASAKNEELVGGKVVQLEKDVSETDKYGRLLRYVYVDDLFVNVELVRLG